MTDQQATTVQDTTPERSQLLSQLFSESEKKQLQLISQLISIGESGWEVLMDFLKSSDSVVASVARGTAYQALYLLKNPKTQEFLENNFPKGIFPLKSDRNIDYQPLQELLLQQDFQNADSLTLKKLCEIAGEDAVKRKWLYFTEVEQFPVKDLHTLNSLWWIYSEGKFGFSVQRRIWLSVGQDFTKLWPRIGWRNGNNWTQYPNEFTWDLSAPAGHLPLLNQLRGVRVTASLFAHPVWFQYNW